MGYHLNFPRQEKLEKLVKNYNFQWERKRPLLGSDTSRQEPPQPYFKKTKNEHLNSELPPQRSTAGLFLDPRSQQAVLPLVPSLRQPHQLRKVPSAALFQGEASQQFPSCYVLISLTLLWGSFSHYKWLDWAIQVVS